MNRIRCTLQHAYAEGFRERLGLLKHAARKFAATARWSEEHASWTGSEQAVNDLCTAAFEVWHWERLHADSTTCFPKSTAGRALELFSIALCLGAAVYTKKPSERLLLDLLTEAVNFTMTTKENTNG